MNKDNEQFCLQCGASVDSLKYQIPPHSSRSDAKFCKQCGAIIRISGRRIVSNLDTTTKDP